MANDGKESTMREEHVMYRYVRSRLVSCLLLVAVLVLGLYVIRDLLQTAQPTGHVVFLPPDDVPGPHLVQHGDKSGNQRKKHRGKGEIFAVKTCSNPILCLTNYCCRIWVMCLFIIKLGVLDE